MAHIEGINTHNDCLLFQVRITYDLGPVFANNLIVEETVADVLPYVHETLFTLDPSAYSKDEASGAYNEGYVVAPFVVNQPQMPLLSPVDSDIELEVYAGQLAAANFEAMYEGRVRICGVSVSLLGQLSQLMTLTSN